MTLTLDLAPDLEARLRRRAAQEGGDEQAVALRLLAKTLAEEEEPAGELSPARSMADLFSGRVGLVAGSGEAYSENGGQRFTEYVTRKHEQP